VSTAVDVAANIAGATTGTAPSEVKDAFVNALTSPPPPPGPESLGVNTNPTKGSQVMPTKTGPIPPDAWNNPTQIVGNLRQDSGKPGDVSGDDRCGPTNLLAATLLQGKDKAAALVANAAKSPNLSPGQQQQLKDISQGIKLGTASYDDLNKAGSLMYQAANTRTTVEQAVGDKQHEFDVTKLSQPELDTWHKLSAKKPEQLTKADQKTMSDLLTKATGVPSQVNVADDPRQPGKKVAFVNFPGGRPGDSSGLDDGELASFAKTSGLKTSGGKLEEGDSPRDMLPNLKPGQATVMRVGLTNGENPNHFVTVGKLPDGRPYIYNPSPQSGEATLAIGSKNPPQPPGFDEKLGALEGKIKNDPDPNNSEGIATRSLTIH
jgi:hypothetical protein